MTVGTQAALASKEAGAGAAPTNRRPIRICECGNAYVPTSARQPGCERCMDALGLRRKNDTRFQTRSGYPQADFVDAKRERRRAQWRAYKDRVRRRAV